MPSAHARTEILIGRSGVEKLSNKTVFIAGLGGVGGYAVEAVVRAGVGKVILLDHDVVAPSNLNRQLIALHSSIGMLKTQVMAKRLKDIAPNIEIILLEEFLMPDMALDILEQYRADYLLDCIDTIASKVALVCAAQRIARPVISAMGAGNCLDVERVKVALLADTTVCPLAREMRRNVRKLGGSLYYPVVFSNEARRQPLPHSSINGIRQKYARAINGTISYLPALFGEMMAGFVIKSLLNDG